MTDAATIDVTDTMICSRVFAHAAEIMHSKNVPPGYCYIGRDLSEPAFVGSFARLHFDTLQRTMIEPGELVLLHSLDFLTLKAKLAGAKTMSGSDRA